MHTLVMPGPPQPETSNHHQRSANHCTKQSLFGGWESSPFGEEGGVVAGGEEKDEGAEGGPDAYADEDEGGLEKGEAADADEDDGNGLEDCCVILYEQLRLW